MDPTARDGRGIGAGILLGLGLGGFVDGIVLHQLLQWHHMVSHVGRYPTTTVAGLEANTFADGLLHAATWLCTVGGLVLLWAAPRRPGEPRAARAFVGLLLVGWGLFNVVEEVVDHHLLGLHHVKEDAANRLAWDLGFLLWGAAMIAGGTVLSRAGRTNTSAEELVT